MNIAEAASRFHWFKIAEDGVVELFLDHHSLSTFRMCEASFELSMMGGVKSKERSWNLEFGIVWHRMAEHFYIAKRDGNFEAQAWLERAITYWVQNNMDEFAEHSMYKKLGGLMGFVSMCAQYAEFFAQEVDRLRVIGIEITFGKKREVPLGEFVPYKYAEQHGDSNVRCFLTGRIDFLMDNGHAIGPLDHKSTAFFGKTNPVNSYDPQEGMTGYVYATSFILKKYFPELLGQRKVDRIWMNFASVSPDKDNDPCKRFKRTPIYKTEYQLEQFRLRQLSTFQKIYDMVIYERRPDWNTSVCNNMFHSECKFRNLHRQNTSSAMLNVLNQDFIVAPIWNPEEVDK